MEPITLHLQDFSPSKCGHDGGCRGKGLLGENSGVTKWYGWADWNNSISPGDSLKSEKGGNVRVKKGRCPPHLFLYLLSFLSLPHLYSFPLKIHPSPCTSALIIARTAIPSLDIFHLLLLLHYCFLLSFSPSPLLFSSRGSLKCQCIVLGDTADKNGVR